MDRKKSPCSFDPTTNWAAKTKPWQKVKEPREVTWVAVGKRPTPFLGRVLPAGTPERTEKLTPQPVTPVTPSQRQAERFSPKIREKTSRGAQGNIREVQPKTPRSFHSAQLVSPLEAVTRASLQCPKPKKPCRCGGMTGSRISLSESQAIAFE